MSKINIIAVSLILISLLVIVPTSFASDNQTGLNFVGNDTNVLTEDYYFDSTINNDTGNGSELNPYKELTSDRIQDNSVIHLAKGEYSLRGFSAENITIIGESSQNTIINMKSYAITTNNYLTLYNVTLIKAPISNSYNLTAVNVVFRDSARSAITSSGSDAHVNLINCTFDNNYAQSGAVINMNDGFLNISGSVFTNNYAQYYGGAICIEEANATITSSKFINDYSMNDAGGAIYILNSPEFVCSDTEFNNCNALFGGAIASLSSNVSLNRVTVKNNNAKYYGGAVFALYDVFTINSSVLDNNSAENGGALYVDAVEIFNIQSNIFTNNKANKTAGAVYSVLSEYFYESIYDKALNNTFKDNHAVFENDIYASNVLNLTVGDNDYILVRYNATYNGTLPSSYDLRDYNQVTAVRSQGNGGNCWSFSAIAALESAILKATGITYDFSEENMKNLMSLYSDYGWAMETNSGGYDKMGVGYLASWLGPVNETDDVYYHQSVLSPVLHSFYHVQNILFFTRSNYTDNDAIKKAIMDYGAVSTSVYWSSAYLKGKSYYFDGSSGANHAVAIVGWDDNYSKSNFRNTPPADGAWIIKNSWGTSGGDKGFYYVSYYDTRFACTGKAVSYVIVFNDTIRFDKNYQYDIAGRTDNFFNTTNTVWYKNRFTATSNEYLAAVSTYFEKNTNWDLSVYVNDKLKLTQSGYSVPSYSTINLDKVIPLKLGDIFEVVFKIVVDGDVGVPISEAVSLNQEIYSEGCSFISYDGKNWKDFYELSWTYPDHSYASQVACIKAFTVLDKLKTYIKLDVLNEYNPSEISATVYTQDGAIVKSGIVTFNIEGNDIEVSIKDGVAKLTYLFKNFEDTNIAASFNGEGYVGNSTTITCDVNYAKLSASNLETYYASIIQFSAVLTDRYGVAIPDKEVRFSVNNQDYVVKTNSKGIAAISPILDLGTYRVTIGFNDDLGRGFNNLTKTITVKSTIELSAQTKFTYNSQYQTTLYDTKGTLLKNKEVSIFIDDVAYELTTDANGVAKCNIELSVGTHTVTVVNPYSGELKSQKINVVARINGNKALTMYYGSGSSYKVRAYDDNGNIAKGVVVTFKINGKTYSRTTDSNGYASLKINLAPKTYTIVASYKGYNVSNKVVVKPTLVLKDKTVKKSKTFKYTVKLLNKNGKILKNKYVKVKFKGKTYKAKTNSKGIATFKIKSYSKIGKFTLTAIYGSAKISKKITVKK